MTWLTPLTGLLLALAVIPPLVLLYFLRLKRQPQPIASTLLWTRSVEDLQANAPFQRLRRNILLFLQLLALILLIIAVMQPQVQAGEFDGGKVIFLIDNSASMSATDLPGGEMRLERAQRLARQRIEALYGGGLFTAAPDETMIVAFSDRAEIVQRFTNSRTQLMNAIDRIEPTHGETRLDEALALARAYTTNVVDDMGEARPTGEPAHLELFSDGRIEDIDQHVLRGESVSYHAIGTDEPDNVAFASISAERPYDRPTHIEVFASLINFNLEEVRCDVQLSVNGSARGIREIRVPAGGTDPNTGEFRPGRNNVVFSPFEMPRGAVIEIANLRPDDLGADNVVQLVVPPPRRLHVALVEPQSFAIRRAVSGLPLERVVELNAADYERLAENEETDQFDVVIFDAYEPEHLPRGRYLMLGAPPPIEPLRPVEEGGAQLVLATNDQHPIMRYVNLDQLFIEKFQRLDEDEHVEVLAEGSHGPLVTLYERGAMHIVYVPFDPLDSNWPLLPSFVNFIYNAVEYLGHAGESVVAEGIRPGESITARLPANAQDIELTKPDGMREAIQPLDPAQLSWGPVRKSGLYVLRWSEPGIGTRQSRAFAVSLLSETEGDLRVAPELEIGRDRIEGRPADRAAYIALWPYALGLCLLLLMLEWWVYHRKTAV